MGEDYDWDQAAASWDSSAAVIDYSERAFETLLERGTPDGWPRVSVLDFGCGTGTLSMRLARAGAQVTSLDTSPAMIAALNDKVADLAVTGITTLCAPLDAAIEAGQLTGAFDLIVASSVLAFVDDATAVLRSLRGVLAQGGRIVHWDWQQAPGDSFGFTVEQLAQAHGEAGLTTHYAGPGFSLGPGGPGLDVVMGVAA